jgi:hypothetical protein
MQGAETPVETGYSKVLGEPVFQLIFPLRSVSRERGAGGGDERCRGSGCILRAALWPVGAHLEGRLLQHDPGLIRETC